MEGKENVPPANQCGDKKRQREHSHQTSATHRNAQHPRLQEPATDNSTPSPNVPHVTSPACSKELPPTKPIDKIMTVGENCESVLAKRTATWDKLIEQGKLNIQRRLKRQNMCIFALKLQISLIKINYLQLQVRSPTFFKSGSSIASH